MKTGISKKKLIAGIFFPFALAISLPTVAQNNKSSAASSGATSAKGINTTVRDMRASEVIGKRVTNEQGENLGKIEDFIVNVDNERVLFAVVSFGGALGVGDKLFAYPVQTFRASEKGDALVLNVSKEQMKKAPGFDRDKRPNFSKDSYHSDVERYFFKEDSARRTPSGERVVSASDLMGKDVNDRAAHDAGEIKDLVVNLGTGSAYVVFDFDKSWSPDDKLMPMPLKAFKFPTRPDLDVVLSVDREKIDMARGFEKDKWPDLNSESYRKTISAQLASIRSQIKDNPAATQTGRESASGSSR